jgi:hypothetical protein
LVVLAVVTSVVPEPVGHLMVNVYVMLMLPVDVVLAGLNVITDPLGVQVSPVTPAMLHEVMVIVTTYGAEAYGLPAKMSKDVVALSLSAVPVVTVGAGAVVVQAPVVFDHTFVPEHVPP